MGVGKPGCRQEQGREVQQAEENVEVQQAEGDVDLQQAEGDVGVEQPVVSLQEKGGNTY